MNDPIIIIGAGQAGSELALTLRRGGCRQRIVLYGEEKYLPYRRPALSKGFLSGEVPESALYHATAKLFTEHNIEFIASARIVHIDAIHKYVVSADGQRLSYSKLAFATGGRPRALECSGADLTNVRYLRTIDDACALRNTLTQGKRLVIIGGGFIGLEIAATANKQGVDVTVLEAGSRVLRRATCDEMASFITEQHRSTGIKIAVDQQVQALRSSGSKTVTSVECKNGNTYLADVVVAGIGLIANDELAAAAGLDVKQGIIVNELGQTSDSNIVAVGDCANSMNTFCGHRLRLESVQGAMEQARTAALTILGKGKAICSVPTFWSDQCQLKLQMIGVPRDTDQVITRCYPSGELFAAFYLSDGLMKAAHFVNCPVHMAAARKLITEQIPVSEKDLLNPSIPLSDLLAATAA